MKIGRIDYEASVKIPTVSTCILLCGISNSGKSTFAKKWFDHNAIVSSDDILLKLVEMHPDVNFMNYQIIQNKSIDLFWENVFVKCGSNLLVIDTMCINYKYRKELIDFVSNFFKNVILIVFNLPLETVLSRSKKDYGSLPVIYSPENSPANYVDLINQLNSGDICYGVDTVYVLDSNTINQTSVVFT